MITGYKVVVFISCILMSTWGFSSNIGGKPNILWIIIEDASCHISCYGETAIETPSLDKLAFDGIRFENAFVSSPVCSPSRSALVTGMVQNTLCTHNHRSQVYSGKGGGNREYFESFKLPEGVRVASKHFEKAGYYTTNESLSGEKGKEDYNFMDKDTYSGTSWKNAPDGTPFFAQIQLHGGKNRKRRANTEDFELPPYYYNDEVMRNDWKDYLGSWLDTDMELKQIVADLKAAGKYDNTLIFLLTDHGVSHLRGKQFLYDEGLKVPLIVKFPENKNAGKVRKDMVMQIDLLPTSLAFSGLPIPDNIQGKDIFARDYEKQKYTFAFRDRCDETTELIRSVRSEKFKYIRNFLSYLPHSQRNQYKDSKQISIHMRELYTNGKLNEVQSRFYASLRPAEELYDLQNDPYEINNLANDPKFKSELEKLRSVLYAHMIEIKDAGLIPEPILEELGKKHGTKYFALRQAEFSDIQARLIGIIEAGEQRDIDVLIEAARSNEPSERYWAVTWLGVNDVKSAKEEVKELTKDKDPTVRIAANLALFKLDSSYNPIPALGKEVNHQNLIVGLYAMSAIEQSGIRNSEVKEVSKMASENKYEFTKRYGKYLVNDK